MVGNRTLALVAVTALVLSGCAGGELSGASGTPGPSDPVSSEAVEAAPGVHVAVNRGSVRGSVINEAELPIKGARVSLLATEYFTDTGASGTFFFENVSLGAYQLSVQAPGFKAHLQEVNVEAGKLAEIQVVLPTDDSLDAAFRPHVHDYWGDRSEVVLMDADVDLTTREANGQSGLYSDPSYARTAKANRNSTQPEDNYRFAIRAASDSDPPIIFPGTRDVRITLTWNPAQIAWDDAGLIIRPANSTGYSWLKPQPSGQSWTITVRPDQADDGHDPYSVWSLFVYASNDAQGSTTAWKPTVIQGPVHVKIVLVKGELYLEAEHPRFWSNGTSAVVRGHTEEIAFSVSDRTWGSGGIRADKGMTVWPGTTRMRIAFWYYYKDALNGTVGNEWVLTWKTPDQPSHGTPLSEYKRANPTYAGAGHKVYDIQVKPEEWDAMYRTGSGWIWMASPKGKENDNQLGLSDDYYRDTMYWRVGVTIYKDEPAT